MSLFDNFNRTYGAPALNNEDKFHFYNRSAWPASARIRDTLETWFTHYPDKCKAELKARLQSEFDSAFHELFLHELLLRIGCEVSVHPSAGNHSKTHPDFLAKFPSGAEVFVEAVLSEGESDEEKSRHALLNTLYDEINKIKSPDFFLGIVSIDNPEGIQPSGRKIRIFLNQKLKSLNPDQISEVPRWIFRDGKFELEAFPIPKSPQSRGKPGHRFIGGEPGGVHWGGSAATLQSSITRKAKQHGRVNKPYIVAINSLSVWGTDEDDISKALYDSQGVFANYSRISAVLVTEVYPSNVPVAPICLYHNPYAAKPCTGFPWRVNQGAYRVKGVSIGELLGLPPKWPRG